MSCQSGQEPFNKIIDPSNQDQIEPLYNKVAKYNLTFTLAMISHIN